MLDSFSYPSPVAAGASHFHIDRHSEREPADEAGIAGGSRLVVHAVGSWVVEADTVADGGQVAPAEKNPQKLSL